MDVSQLDPALNRTYEALINIVKNKELIDIDSSLKNEERKTQVEALKIDGSTIDDLLTELTLPSTLSFEEFCKGNKSQFITSKKVEEYLQVIDLTILEDSIKKKNK